MYSYYSPHITQLPGPQQLPGTSYLEDLIRSLKGKTITSVLKYDNSRVSVTGPILTSGRDYYIQFNEKAQENMIILTINLEYILFK